MTTAAAVATHPSGNRFELVMEPDPSRVALTRRVTERHLRRWGMPMPLAEDVLLAVSELVTNAVCHGHGGTVGLRVQYAVGKLTVEVSDGNPVPARSRSAGERDEHGRGLLIVAALSDDWGASLDGVRTWCTFTAPVSRNTRWCGDRDTSFKDAAR
ncbi:ATP-binding protein [Streptomyces smyrnaeus]|uniref:ATP-binding protein n=1 Tax=Streptomyces smyrnaeus TaxID=1387713 RepID=UPI00340517FC